MAYFTNFATGQKSGLRAKKFLRKATPLQPVRNNYSTLYLREGKVS